MPSLRLFLSLFTLGVVFVRAEFKLPAAREVPLWPGNPPGMVEGATPGADDGTGRYWKVGIPSLLLYQPDSPAPSSGRPALIVCPGGGYTHLTRLVGADGAVAAFLPRDYVVISLKYRTSPPSLSLDTDAAADGRRAIRLARRHAAEWGIDPHRIGVLGWSAGANLALNVASHHDTGQPDAADPVERQSSRPDFVVLLSPWPAKRTIDAYPISSDAPPAFIGSAEDDTVAPVGFARAVAQTYQDSGAPHHLWVLTAGGHGAFTINAPGEGGAWIDRFLPWMAALSSATANQ